MNFEEAVNSSHDIFKPTNSLEGLDLSPSKRSISFKSVNSNNARIRLSLFQRFQFDKDENTSRLGKVKEILSEIKTLIKEKAERNLTKHNLEEHFDQILAAAMKIFPLYGIIVDVKYQGDSDSALHITAISHKKFVARCLYTLAELLSRLPFTLVTEIGLNKFTLCGKISLMKETYKSIYEARVMSNAMFPVYDLKNFEQVEKHFYRMIIYTLQKRDNSLGYEWPGESMSKIQKQNPESYNSVSLTSMSREKSHKKASSLKDAELMKAKEEQERNKVRERRRERVDILRNLLKDPKKVLRDGSMITMHEGNFLKERMESIGVFSFEQGWWDEISKLEPLDSPNLYLLDSHFN